MTEQQAQSPIDDLFRNTFENLPPTPDKSGWDTPSDRVWQQVQANIQAPRKGWGIQSLLLLAGFALAVAAAGLWIISGPSDKTATEPGALPLEAPSANPSAPIENTGSETIQAPKPSTGNNTGKEANGKPAPGNSPDENQAKPIENTAQPLPGSKPTLPPNSTEAKKKKD